MLTEEQIAELKKKIEKGCFFTEKIISETAGKILEEIIQS